MKLATWNVNSLKVRLPHVLGWLAEHQPDILCLQETKLEDQNFPVAELQAQGYNVQASGQKTYNGVALISRHPVTEVVRDIPGFADEQKRLIAATIDNTRVVCAYFPNGQSVASDKYVYKLRWIDALRAWLQGEFARSPRLALAGDFNVAPDDRDVYDPAAWEGQVLVSDPERAAFRDLISIGFRDGFRLFNQTPKNYTWWDYRQGAFRRNLGLRIDHILLSAPLADLCRSCQIDVAPRKLERPSDHVPVIAEFA
jgi:exodeoxyribonuclease III